MEIILRLTEVREEKGFNKTQLANRSGVSLPYLSEIETGKYIPTVEVCCKLCRALEVTPNELIKEKYYR